MATAAATHIPETIRLQLRKPRSWQWELSTSKSSPNIILPVIQLYDCKGQLLVEAKDSGNITRKIWSSNLNSCNQNSDNRTRKSRSRSINTSRSDTATSIIKKSSSAINLPDKKEQTQRYNSLNFADHLDDSKNPIGKSSNLIEKIAIKEAGRRQVYNGLGLEKNRLEKSNSELYDHSGHLSLSKNGGMVEGKIRHRRSKSDDLFRRKLRYNSSAESIKRAEMDGYRNFITPNIADNEIQAPGEKPQTNNSNKNRKGSRNKMMCSVENVTLDGNKRNIELEELRHNLRYTTRTSSAGTLIIPEESFKEPEGDVCRRRRNRRRRDGSVPATMVLDSLTEGLDGESNTKNDFKYPCVERVAQAEKHIRQTSDPTAFLTRDKLEKYAASPASIADRYEPGSKKAESANDTREYQEKEEHNLVSSHSDISTFIKKNDREHVPIYRQNQEKAVCEKLENDKCEKSKIDYYQKKIKNFRNKNVDYREKLKMCREKLNNYRNKNRDCRENDVYRYNRENYEKIISDLRNIAENSYIHENFECNEPVTKQSNRSRQRLRRSRTVDDRSSSSSRERTKFNRKGLKVPENASPKEDIWEVKVDGNQVALSHHIGNLTPRNNVFPFGQQIEEKFGDKITKSTVTSNGNELTMVSIHSDGSERTKIFKFDGDSLVIQHKSSKGNKAETTYKKL